MNATYINVLMMMMMMMLMVDFSHRPIVIVIIINISIAIIIIIISSNIIIIIIIIIIIMNMLSHRPAAVGRLYVYICPDSYVYVCLSLYIYIYTLYICTYTGVVDYINLYIHMYKHMISATALRPSAAATTDGPAGASPEYVIMFNKEWPFRTYISFAAAIEVSSVGYAAAANDM